MFTVDKVEDEKDCSHLHGVLKECVGQTCHLLLIKLHPVLHHTGLHHLPQVTLVY